MKDKVEIPIAIEYVGKDPLWEYIRPRDDHREIELAEGVILRYDMSEFKKALGHPQIDWFSLVIAYFMGYAGYKTYPYIDKAIDKLVALLTQGKILGVKIGTNKIPLTQYSKEELKQIIKEAIDEYIRGE